MTTFSQEEFEQLLHNFEDNPPDFEDNPPDFEDNPLDFEDNSDGFELNFCADIDSLDNELPQPSYFNTTPCPMDASLEVQLAETQNELRSVKSALEDSMKTMEKLMQLHVELRSMKSLIEGLVQYMEQLGPWTAEVTTALHKLGEPPLSAT